MAQGISRDGFLELRSWMVRVQRTDPGSDFVHRLSNVESHCAFANCFTPVVEPVHVRSFFCIRTEHFDIKLKLCIARTVCSFSTKARFIFEVGGNVTVVFSLPFIPRLSAIQLP